MLLFLWLLRLNEYYLPNSVTSIGYSAFNGCSGLPAITLPNSITSIDDWAFAYCHGLTSITIPNGVTRIGSNAFYDCTGLTEIRVEARTPPVAKYSFQNVNLSIPVYVPAASVQAYKDAESWREFTNILGF